MIGKSISHYKILDKLGEGGMFENHPRLPACRRSLRQAEVLFTSDSDFDHERFRGAVLEQKREVLR